eukprot:8563876-Pyramimonas_sp.AAC.1
MHTSRSLVVTLIKHVRSISEALSVPVAETQPDTPVWTPTQQAIPSVVRHPRQRQRSPRDRAMSTVLLSVLPARATTLLRERLPATSPALFSTHYTPHTDTTTVTDSTCMPKTRDRRKSSANARLV